MVECLEQLSLIVINDDTEEYLPRFFESIIKQIPIEDIDIIFVDNASVDSSVEIAQRYGVKNIKTFSKKVKGRGELYHKGFKYSRGQLLLFAHSDMYFASDFFQNLSLYLSSRNNVDFVSFSQYYADGNLFGNNEIGIDFERKEIHYHQIFQALYGVQSYLDLSEGCFMVNKNHINDFGFNLAYQQSFYEYELLYKIISNGGKHEIYDKCKFTHYFIEFHEKNQVLFYDKQKFIKNHQGPFQNFEFSKELTGKDEELKKKDEELKKKDEELKKKDEELKKKDEELTEKVKIIYNHQNQINLLLEKERLLQEILHSKGWRLLERYRKLKSMLFFKK